MDEREARPLPLASQRRPRPRSRARAAPGSRSRGSTRRPPRGRPSGRSRSRARSARRARRRSRSPRCESRAASAGRRASSCPSGHGSRCCRARHARRGKAGEHVHVRGQRDDVVGVGRVEAHALARQPVDPGRARARVLRTPRGRRRAACRSKRAGPRGPDRAGGPVGTSGPSRSIPRRRGPRSPAPPRNVCFLPDGAPEPSILAGRSLDPDRDLRASRRSRNGIDEAEAQHVAARGKAARGEREDVALDPVRVRHDARRTGKGERAGASRRIDEMRRDPESRLRCRLSRPHPRPSRRPPAFCRSRGPATARP